MEQIELSIRLQMNNNSSDEQQQLQDEASKQQQQQPPPTAHSQTAPKVIPQQPGFYPSQSTTPTDLMEITSTCVY